MPKPRPYIASCADGTQFHLMATTRRQAWTMAQELSRSTVVKVQPHMDWYD